MICRLNGQMIKQILTSLDDIGGTIMVVVKHNSSVLTVYLINERYWVNSWLSDF